MQSSLAFQAKRADGLSRKGFTIKLIVDDQNRRYVDTMQTCVICIARIQYTNTRSFADGGTLVKCAKKVIYTELHREDKK